MKPTMLFTLGTPFGCWPGLAAALLRQAPAGADLLSQAFTDWYHMAGDGNASAAALQAVVPATGAAWGGIDESGSQVLDVLAAAFPSARFLVFVEDPATAVAHWASTGSGGDAGAVMRAWRDDARRVLRSAQARPGQCLLVDAAEARRQPQALVATVAVWSGINFKEGPIEAPPATDALAMALGLAAVASDASLRALFEELQASCAVLAGQSPLAATFAMPVLASAGAAQRLLHLQQRDADVDRLLADTAELQTRIQAAETQLKSSREQAQLAEHDSAAQRALKAQIDAMRVENSRVLTQLNQVQEELARHHDTHRTLTTELAAARQEETLLLPQLHQMQEELVKYFDANRALEQKLVELRARVGVPELTVGRVERSLPRDTPPHRELGFTLHRVRLGEQAWPRIELRLIEHVGRAGLMLLAQGDDRPPLSSWQEAGREGDKAYVLLIPEDRATHPHFQRMPTSDWALIEALAHFLEDTLKNDSGLSPRWKTLAWRMREALAAMPVRLRYDGLTVAPAPGADGTFDAAFGLVSFGARRFKGLRLRWSPAGRAGTSAVALLAPADGDGLPVAVWPVTEQGVLALEWALPIQDAPAAELRRAWGAIDFGDRQLLLALLDALPAVAGQVTDAALPPGLGRSELATTAAQPLRRARQALGLSRLGSMLRALRGRPPMA